MNIIEMFLKPRIYECFGNTDLGQFGQMKVMIDGLLPTGYSTFELFFVAPKKTGFSQEIER